MCVPYLTVPRRSSDSCFSRPSYCLLRVGNLTLTGMCALWPGSPVYMGPALMMSFFVCSTNSYLCTSDHLVLHMQLHHLSVFTYGITLICETIENTNTIKPIPQSWVCFLHWSGEGAGGEPCGEEADISFESSGINSFQRAVPSDASYPPWGQLSPKNLRGSFLSMPKGLHFASFLIKKKEIKPLPHLVLLFALTLYWSFHFSQWLETQ